jgi:hypothetical protein
MGERREKRRQQPFVPADEGRTARMTFDQEATTTVEGSIGAMVGRAVRLRQQVKGLMMAPQLTGTLDAETKNGLARAHAALGEVAADLADVLAVIAENSTE